MVLADMSASCMGQPGWLCLTHRPVCVLTFPIWASLSRQMCFSHGLVQVVLNAKGLTAWTFLFTIFPMQVLPYSVLAKFSRQVPHRLEENKDKNRIHELHKLETIVEGQCGFTAKTARRIKHEEGSCPVQSSIHCTSISKQSPVDVWLYVWCSFSKQSSRKESIQLTLNSYKRHEKQAIVWVLWSDRLYNITCCC